MSAPARFRQADLKRAFMAAKACGYDDVRVSVDPTTGRIDIVVGKAANDSPPVELD